MKNLYVPINLNKCHWALIVVFVALKTIRYYDSLESDPELKDFYLNTMLRYLNDVYKDKNVNDMCLEEWTLVRGNKENTPVQEDKCSCGIFVLGIIDLIEAGIPVEYFQQAHVDRFRTKICSSLLSNEKLPE
jgi:Ulp1 family protease